ncbi:MAG: invasion associated locus B family protein [Proteobacteria bacterium]|nr:invasion associated locus B family protein [Pseudomonadota bacterium]
MRTTIIGAVLAVAFIAVLFVMARLNPHAPTTESLDSLAAHIQSGYVGNQKLGDWDVNCTATAMIMGGAQSQQQPANKPQKRANSQTNQSPVPLTLNPAGTTEQMPSTNPEAATTTTDAPATPATPPAATDTQETPKTPAKPISFGRCHVTKIFRSKQNPQQAVMMVSFRQIGPEHNLVMIIRMPPLAKKGEAVILALGKQGLKIPVLGCAEKQGCTAMGGIAAGPQAQLFSASQAVLVFPQGQNGQRPQVRLPLTGLPEAVTAMRRADPKG